MAYLRVFNDLTDSLRHSALPFDSTSSEISITIDNELELLTFWIQKP